MECAGNDVRKIRKANKIIHTIIKREMIFLGYIMRIEGLDN